MKKHVRNSLIGTAVTLLAMAPAAWGQPNVSISIKAEREVMVKEKGKDVRKKVPAKGVKPGEEIVYTISYVNSGNEAATDVVLTDPIPAGTAFIPGSATEAGDLTFSIDKGKSYKKPTLLTYEIKTSSGTAQKRVASPEEYTDIRWTIPSVAAGGKGSVHFRVKVK
jgi:uncharacterized repeat protein (TIGR01451 family)